jgi:hypothetical protein
VRTKPVLLVAWILALSAASSPARAVGSPPTHGALLDSLAHRVADELLAGTSIPAGRPVSVEHPIAGDTLGALGQSLLERLASRGVPVRLLPAPGGWAAGGSVDSAASTGRDGGDLVLSVRVAASGVTYVRALHGFPARVNAYERLAYMRANATLLEGPSRSVVWTRSAAAETRDRVCKGDLVYVATGSGGLNPAVPRGGSFRFLEPAIVLGVVTGLVVLFYSNRN